MVRSLGFSGAATVAAASLIATAPQAQAIELAVENNQCPTELVITAFNGTPNASVRIVYSPNAGAFTIPGGSCAGVPLGLDGIGIQQVGTIVLDNDGFGFLQYNNVPAFACNGYVQLVEVPTCNTSSVWSLIP